jgi:hypothetical protein
MDYAILDQAKCNRRIKTTQLNDTEQLDNLFYISIMRSQSFLFFIFLNINKIPLENKTALP